MPRQPPHAPPGRRPGLASAFAVLFGSVVWAWPVAGTLGEQPSMPPARPASADPHGTAHSLRLAQGVVLPTIILVGEIAEDVYDVLKAGNWHKADRKLVAMEDAARRLPGDVEPNQRKKLDASVAATAEAVHARQRLAAMREANEVTRIVAELTTPFEPRVPVEVALLDYYGRALEVGATASDMILLRTTAREIRETWAKVRPLVRARGKLDEVSRFDRLLGGIEAAASPSAYAHLAARELDEVDRLERVFVR